jgi:hypothetical protein
MDYAFAWLLTMLFVAIAGSFFVPGHDDNDSFWNASSNYRLNGYKYLNREL